MTGMYNLLMLTICGSIIVGINSQKYLSVNGTSLYLNGEKVFLSGVNQAWYMYGDDFGNNGYTRSKPHLMNTLDAIKSNGGNSLRMWVHISGGRTPLFNSSGHVISPGPNTTRDLLDYVREAKKRNILVTLSLWNGAVMDPKYPVYKMIQNESILQTYIQNALIPIVRALKNENSMAIWEIINEPEGAMQMEVENKTVPCYDTSSIRWWDFADWTEQKITLQHYLRFIGQQAIAIHTEDPKALVTVGSWTYRSVTSAIDRRNFYSDYCLQYANNGNMKARLDLYQIHTYDTFHIFLPHDPFMIDASVYKFDRPIIIGEFSQKKGGFFTIGEQFRHAYYHGYNGAWSWSAIDSDDASDSLGTQEKGLQAIKDLNDQEHGGRVNIILQVDIKPESDREEIGKVTGAFRHGVGSPMDRNFEINEKAEDELVRTFSQTNKLPVGAKSDAERKHVGKVKGAFDKAIWSPRGMNAKFADIQSKYTNMHPSMSRDHVSLTKSSSWNLILEFFKRVLKHEF